MDVLNPMFLLGLVEFLAILAVAFAGIARWRRRRSRLDRVGSTVASAAAMSVYPPSLRGGGPEVPPRPDEEPRSR
jgi:ribosomal protein L4